MVVDTEVLKFSVYKATSCMPQNVYKAFSLQNLYKIKSKVSHTCIQKEAEMNMSIEKKKCTNELIAQRGVGSAHKVVSSEIHGQIVQPELYSWEYYFI